MKKESKRIKQLKTLISQPSYSLIEGIELLKKLGTAKFLESVEAHISLNIDPKYGNQQLRTSLVLPNGTGKTLKIAVFPAVKLQSPPSHATILLAALLASRLSAFGNG
jgi:large subunit ribosomal protein L1